MGLDTLAGLANTLYAFVYFLAGCLVLQVVIVALWLLPVGRKRKKLWFHTCVSNVTWFFLHTMITTRRVALNDHGETFEKPAVIIANHQSFIDILILLSLHPKLVMVTNSWVWRSPFFGRIVRYADFYHTADGYDSLAGTLREKVADGYSVVVFPEGTRSADMTIGRFHKGAFYLAQQLGLDIVPVVLYGNGLASSKRQPFYIKKSLLVSKVLPRIASGKEAYGSTAKSVRAYFIREYGKVYEEYNRTCNPYFYDALIKNYTYKGPVLEWYMRVKVRMEKSYDLFDRTVPRDASVVDIGCGYGALACETAAVDIDARAEFCFFLPCLHLDLRHGGDRGQRLAPEPESPERIDIVHRADLARRVPFEGHSRILRRHSAPVVLYLDKLSAAVAEIHRDRPGPRIHGVLHELLHHRRRAVHHLAGGDLIRNGIGKEFYTVGHG